MTREEEDSLRAEFTRRIEAGEYTGNWPQAMNFETTPVSMKPANIEHMAKNVVHVWETPALAAQWHQFHSSTHWGEFADWVLSIKEPLVIEEITL